MPFPPIPPDIPAIVTEVATTYHLPADLVWCIVWRESENTRRHITPNDGGSGAPSLGRMQVHLPTVQAMGGGWRYITTDALLNPKNDLDLEAGCSILRWRLYQVLAQRGWAMRMDGWRPDYEHQLSVVMAFTPEHRRDVLSHAVAAYGAGDVAVQDWPNLTRLGDAAGRVKREYVRDVMKSWDALQGGGP